MNAPTKQAAAPVRLYTLAEVTAAVYGNDRVFGGGMATVRTTIDVALRTVLGMNAHTSAGHVVHVDLGNGYILSCTLRRAEELH